MHFLTVVPAAALSFAAGSDAWAQAADGTWIANNNFHSIDGFNVHEPCTIRNTRTIVWYGFCEYWINGEGGKNRGECTSDAGFGVICLSR